MSQKLRLAGIDAGSPRLGPETIHVDITNGCNTNCVTCWDHSPLLTIGRSTAWKRQRAELSAVEAILDDAVALGGLRAVILSGMGEPFTHPDVYAMAAAVKGRGLHLTVITNLIPADAGRILELGIDQLLIGIHAGSEASYRAFHPSFQAGEWNRLHAMLHTFQEAGRRFKHVQVISRHNADELVVMLELAARYDAAQVNFKLASLKEGTERARITPEQRTRLLQVLVPRAQERARELAVSTNLEVFARQLAASVEDETATAPIAEIGCFMGYSYARVLVNGTVLFCCNTEVVVGTLANGARFADLWTGEAWQALRERMRRGEYLPSCQQCGKVNQNVKLAARFESAYGRSRLLEVTGRGAA